MKERPILDGSKTQTRRAVKQDRGALGLTTYVLVGPKGVRYVGLHNSAEECWTVALGWPPESEIEEYKSNGFAVYPAMVTWREPKK